MKKSKVESTEQSGDKNFLNRVSKKKMKFYKAIWNNYHERDIISIDKTRFPNRAHFIIYLIKQFYINDPNLGSQMWVIYLAFLHITKKDPMALSVADIETLHKKYWKRFHTYYWTKKKRGASLPHLPKTRALKEFLSRGFVHEDTMMFSNATPYKIRCNIGPLVWFEAFSSQAEAIKVLDKVGIPGWSGVPLVKK